MSRPIRLPEQGDLWLRRRVGMREVESCHAGRVVYWGRGGVRGVCSVGTFYRWTHGAEYHGKRK